MMRACGIALACLFVIVGLLIADGPRDNDPDNVRPVPPPGIAIAEQDRAELRDGADALGRDIDAVRAALKGKPALRALLPDVQVYYNAVHYALKYNEFFQAAEVGVARKLLEQGRERAKQLRAGQAPWTTATGLVVRGYVSKIDGSVQPYGLVVPPSYRAGTAVQHRLDIWFHGRGETLTELNFINGRQRSAGEFAPPHAFVLHPYGRYCNANHFAGEIDTLEALAHVQQQYSIDENRVAVRGFSMGGAACWNFAVHYADRWAAAAPGAGFSETPDFLRVFQHEKLDPTWWEKKLWHLYDCTDWARNLAQCPTVAYSGEVDSQKQAADVMARAMTAEGMDLVHIIGPKTGHGYHPDAKAEINRRIDSIVAKGREAVPRRIHFVTWTLRYPKMGWVTVDGLEKHWERATVDARIIFPPSDRSSRKRADVDVIVAVRAKNVAALTLSFPAGYCPFDTMQTPVMIFTNPVNGTTTSLQLPKPGSDRSWVCRLVRDDGKWKIASGADDDGTLRKRPGLQGPIDDAFMDRIIMVRPTGKPLNVTVGNWAAGEMRHAIDHWRKQFRGEIEPRDDTAVTDADIASSNLVLWGDPSSNRILAKVARTLPIGWTADGVTVGKQTFPAKDHVPALIYPNPLNPKKYVVINSGFTFREYDYLNNARQVPRLPDWAILDVSQPPTTRTPAGIATAGFFDETWKLPANP